MTFPGCVRRTPFKSYLAVLRFASEAGDVSGDGQSGQSSSVAGPSRITSCGILSSRRPRNDDWRMRLSWVQVEKLTCATNFGLTHETFPRASAGSFSNGVVFCAK